MNNVKNCGNCRFYRGNKQDIRTGTCHRFPPKAAVIMNEKGPMMISDFTPTKLIEWCGEFIPKHALVDVIPLNDAPPPAGEVQQ